MDSPRTTGAMRAQRIVQTTRRLGAACVAAGLLVSGCASGESDPNGSGNAPTSCESCTCPPGFSADSSGICTDSPAVGHCPNGTRPVLGDEGCVPVGATTCATGFQPRSDGWGCEAVVAATRCEGATREALGSSECVPIGDCNALFPPPDATRFVDDDFTDAELDDTHFRTISEAIALAPAGAVIAIEAGTYIEGMDITRAVTLIGRCAASVRIQSSGDLGAGVQAMGVSGVAIKGIELRGHRGGVLAVGGDIDIDNCVLSNNRLLGVGAFEGARIRVRGTRVDSVDAGDDGSFGFGAFAIDGGQIDLFESVITDGQINGVAVVAPTSLVRLERSVVQRTRPDAAGNHGKGLAVVEGTLEIVESLVRDNRTAGVAIEDVLGTARIERSVIERTEAHISGLGGQAVESFGGVLHVEDTTLLQNKAWGVALGNVKDPVGEATVLRSTIIGSDVDIATGGGIIASGFGSVRIEDTAIVRSQGAGLALQDGAHGLLLRSLVAGTIASPAGDGIGVSVVFGSDLTMDDSAIASATTLGLFVAGTSPMGLGSHAALTKSVIMSTRADAAGQFGGGIQVQSGAVELDGSAVVDNLGVGILAGEPGTTLRLNETLVRNTSVEMFDQRFGHAVMLVAGAMGNFTGGALLSSEGVGLAVAESSATLAGVDIAENTVGIHAQGGSSIREVSALPSQPSAMEVLVDGETRFLDNGARTGSGEIVVPQLKSPL